MRSFIFVALILSLTALPRVGATGLAWEKNVIEVSANPDQQEVKAEFPFRNEGNRPITIQSITTSCGCTTAALDKKSYAPGEGGKIQVTFTVGERTGTQEKYITVQTDGPGQPAAAELLLRINIHAYLAFEPHILFWKVEGEATEKTITCTALLPTPVVLTAASSDNPAIITRIETVEPGRKYYLHLKPTTTAEKLNATIQMNFAIAGSPSRTFSAYASISRRTPYPKGN
ncbi:MAG TPA: DUF1573 domain-containing protein [Opitutaceae bacterium]|jgi:hypothetical protein|nr:DUF1573 domain-containing protein [Opitutaceae bacterium]